MLMKVPKPKPWNFIEYPKLTGGLNLRELEYQLRPEESPYMKNMVWGEGVLQSRDGQNWVSEVDTLGKGYTCYRRLFWSNAFFHIGSKIFYGDPRTDKVALKELTSGVPEIRGTFFVYQDSLFYKTTGAFIQIDYDPDTEPHFKASKVEDKAFVPTIALNCRPDTGAGDLYQPENRLSPKKIFKYNAEKGKTVYHLPFPPDPDKPDENLIDSVVEIKVDGKVLESSKYTVDLKKATVTFTSEPPVTDPPTNNTVEITVSKANPDAKKAILDCKYAIVAGGEQVLCILMAGSTKQPNAVFWNANDDKNMSPYYWPIETYNLVSDTEDPVTGFGLQYKDIIVFKEQSVGKLSFSVETIQEKDTPSFTYQNINDRIGCDCPWSIQLVDNNLVFANTYSGVHIVKSSSAAFENNIDCISLKVNGDEGDIFGAGRIAGLLKDIRAPGEVCSFDDDDRYWLCANGHVFLWDYTISNRDNPSWFYLTDIHAVSFFVDEEHHLFHMNAKGQVTVFGRYFIDYRTDAIDKVYQFPATNFGTYEYLKDVPSILIAVRGDTDTVTRIMYSTDYEDRYDLTDISTWNPTIGNMDLSGVIVGYYNMVRPKYAKVVRRRPGCRHIRHFSLTLSNNEKAADLAIVSAKVFYTFAGKER